MTVKNLLEKIPDILLAQLASFSIIYGLTSSLCLTYPTLKIFLMVMLCVMVIYIFFYNKKSSVAATFLLGAVFFAGIMYIAFGTGIHKVITFLDGYFYWLSEFIQYSDTPDPLYQLITVIALCILISIFTHIFIIKRFSFLVILGAGMGLFTIQWSYGILSSLIPFYLCLLVTLISYLKHVYTLRAIKGANEYAKSSIMTAWSLPVCLIIIVSASLIHASDKPIEWKWLDKKIVSVYNYFNRNMDYEAFDYFSLSASSGFGDRNNLLGGRVKLDRTNVLRVTTNKKVYLKGVSKDIYTGTTWINSLSKKTPIGTDYSTVYNDTAEMLQGMKILTGKEDFLEDYFDINKVTVTFLNLKTKSLFIPSKTTAFIPRISNITSFISNTGDLSTAKRLTKGFNYVIEMYSPKIGTEEFANTMRKSEKGLYDDSSSHYSFVDRSVNEQLAGNYLKMSQLKDSSTKVYDNYLQLPQNLPQRVKDLSTSLVASSKNDYDKAKAIEQYLSSNYPYNLDVRSTPRNRDFVDYFLFDLKQGYCSYYASAMTVLARCAGLPARYVEGYMLPPEPLKDDKSTYVVTNMQAHAWVEIYFEGYGWLPFEPTSPFRSNFYSSENSDAVYAAGYNPIYDDYMEMMQKYNNRDGADFDFNIVATKDKTSASFIILITIGIFTLLLTVLLLFNILRNRYRLYKLINLPAKECILHFYDYYISVLDILGLGFKPAETPFQYSGRIDALMFFSPVKFKVITDIFVKSRYSLNEATEKEKLQFCDFQPGFQEEIKVNMGKFRYFVFKYILGRF